MKISSALLVAFISGALAAPPSDPKSLVPFAKLGNKATASPSRNAVFDDDEEEFDAAPRLQGDDTALEQQARQQDQSLGQGQRLRQGLGVGQGQRQNQGQQDLDLDDEQVQEVPDIPEQAKANQPSNKGDPDIEGIEVEERSLFTRARQGGGRGRATAKAAGNSKAKAAGKTGGRASGKAAGKAAGAKKNGAKDAAKERVTNSFDAPGVV
ncbi:hypothetical protein CDD82_850 [Ophiocordyceps australis]|uniref:Uncharacterized protein n=1 Tax=Ophiocordyceps australis TaxID=1399860 RepID=A0A2C5YTI1_9HYPO|nr:hypothetical protein CDD82_850 [Ophiocordyceps australis]